MPYVLVQGSLDPSTGLRRSESTGSKDGGEVPYAKPPPFCVSVAGLKANELSDLRNFSPRGNLDNYTITFPQHPVIILNALEVLGFRWTYEEKPSGRPRFKPSTNDVFSSSMMEDHSCCSKSSPGVQQSLTELEFERGIWSAALDPADTPRLKKLLQRDASLSGAVDSSGYTPLHYAARAGNADAILILLSAGADPNSSTRSGAATPLHRAAYAGRIDCVKILLDHGADPGLQDADGLTALHKAAEGKKSDCYDLISRKSPALETVKDKKGRTPKDC